MLGYVRLEALRVIRDGGYLVTAIAMPLVMYLIFTNIGATGGSDTRTIAGYVMVSMAGYGAIGAVLNSGVGIAEDRPLGWLRQLRVTPLSPRRVVLGRALVSMAVSLPAIALVCLAAAVVNGVRFDPGQWVAIVGLLWAGVVPFALLGLGIGYLGSAQQAQAVGVTTLIGGSLLGGLWFPATLFPHWLRSISELTPINRYGELSWRIAAGHAPTLTDAAILLGWFAGFAALATFAYRRAGRTT